MDTRFWIYTFRHFVSPGGFGVHVKYGKQPNQSLIVEAKGDYYPSRDIRPVERNDRLQAVNFESYDQYKKHQAAKFKLIIGKGHGWKRSEILDYRLRFWRRFRHLKRYCTTSSLILCLGARQGTEVEVLRELGYEKAIGIDLEPGPDNSLVTKGDFNDLPYEDGSVDAVYSNCIDHVFDIDMFLSEQNRILRPGGLMLLDFARYNRAEAPGSKFESFFWNDSADIRAHVSRRFATVLDERREKNWHWVLFAK